MSRALGPHTMDGYDIAGSYQPNFPWHSSREAGDELAAFKATQGTGFTDSWLTYNRTTTEQLGFRYRGIYAWITPGVDIAAQVAHFVAVIGDLHLGEFIQLDEEQSPLSLDECVLACELFSQRYPGRVAHYGGAFFDGFGHLHPRLRPWPWWMAWYGRTTMPAVAFLPTLWQWGGSHIDGLPKDVDSNQIIDRGQLDGLAGYSAPIPPPLEEIDMFLIQVPKTDPLYLVGEEGAKRLVPAVLGEPITRKLGSTLMYVTAEELAAFPEKTWGA